MVDDYPYALASDFAVNRILKEAPESFHKLDNDDVIQVYMDLFGTDPADDMSMNKGGMMDINRMTAPLGYAAGGPAPKESGGLQPPTGLSKWYADKFPVDPIHQLKENIIDKGKRAAKGIGRGISGLAGIGQELLGAGPAEASEVGLTETLRLLKLQLMLEKGMPGSVLMPSGDPNKIKRLEDKIQQIEIELGE